MKKLILSLTLLLLVSACASPKPKTGSAEITPAPTASAPVETAPALPSDTSSADVVVPQIADSSDPLNDPKGILSKRSVYYALDSYVVEESDKAVVQAHAKYLSEHPKRKVRLEGNADERGSNEYNLALGQRRADGVKKMLMLGGAKESQIESVSYGEEKPKASGHDEASWAQNRRVDFNY